MTAAAAACCCRRRRRRRVLGGYDEYNCARRSMSRVEWRARRHVESV